MPKINGKAVLVQLRKDWVRKALASWFFLTLAMTVLIAALLYKFFSLSLYAAVPLSVLFFAVAFVINKKRRLTEGDVSDFLNRSVPSLEESAHLFLAPDQSLNLLQKLQVKKIEPELISLKVRSPFSETVYSLVGYVASCFCDQRDFIRRSPLSVFCKKI